MSYNELEDLASKIGDPTTADEDLFDHTRKAHEILTAHDEAFAAGEVVRKISSCQAPYVRKDVEAQIRGIANQMKASTAITLAESA